MNTLLRLSSAFYMLIIRLYPARLRQEFGDEIAETFAEDLTDVLQERGMVGAIAVWNLAIREFLRIALPDQVKKPIIAVPGIVFLLCEIVWSAQLMLAFSHESGGVSFEAVLSLVLSPSLVATITSFVAMYTGNRGLPASLRLGLR